jgi:4-hydroxybenzoate polyprenyltransferase
MESPSTLPKSQNALGIAKSILVSVRPKQWTKNLIIYFAFFFTVGEAWGLDDFSGALAAFGKVTLAFLLFSLLTGAVYLVNDTMDAEKDRNHPKKRSRPIASGRLPTSVAWGAAVVFIGAGLSFAFLLEPGFGWVACVYIGVMLAYSLVLKQMVLLDVFSIGTGFVLRAVAGAAVLQAPISPWLYVCTGMGALLIALGKRRSELAIAGENAERQRDILKSYTPGLLDQLIAVVAPSTLIAYTLYTFTSVNLPANHAMMLTVPFVVYGLFRYIYLVHATDLGENPEDILITDIPLIVSIVCWLAVAAAVLIISRG